ncbi:BTB and MATH domain-containing protein 38-like [Mytilus edulis]|uniref:BTB and MATH domain-containing protein 38-like n=1 Tax=Mytilus edulis TaxID=6550 RepID=UPI0039F143C1
MTQMFGATPTSFTFGSAVGVPTVFGETPAASVDRHADCTDEIESKKRLSLFSQHDLIIKIENIKLNVNKEQLMAESPVFEKMFTSDFKEKDKQEIELEGKDVNSFVDFLRCTLPGIDEKFTDKTVQSVIPLADEYQTSNTLRKADLFLAEKSKAIGDKITSEQLITNILQAELYQLPSFLEESITIACRKSFEKFVKNPKFNEITSETRLKIALKRWSDMDAVFKSTNHLNHVSESVDFYKLHGQPVLPSSPIEESGPSFGRGGLSPGASVHTQNLSIQLKPFMQTN